MTATDAQIAGAWSAAVEFLAAEPGRIIRSTRRHQPDGRGRCVECRLPGERWPCVQHQLTQAAIEILAAGAPRKATP